jgi:hypothetical protein
MIFAASCLVHVLWGNTRFGARGLQPKLRRIVSFLVRQVGRKCINRWMFFNSACGAFPYHYRTSSFPYICLTVGKGIIVSYISSSPNLRSSSWFSWVGGLLWGSSDGFDKSDFWMILQFLLPIHVLLEKNQVLIGESAPGWNNDLKLEGFLSDR